jgi:hypothetical protein
MSTLTYKAIADAEYELQDGTRVVPAARWPLGLAKHITRFVPHKEGHDVYSFFVGVHPVDNLWLMKRLVLCIAARKQHVSETLSWEHEYYTFAPFLLCEALKQRRIVDVKSRRTLMRTTEPWVKDYDYLLVEVHAHEVAWVTTGNMSERRVVSPISVDTWCANRFNHLCRPEAWLQTRLEQSWTHMPVYDSLQRLWVPKTASWCVEHNGTAYHVSQGILTPRGTWTVLDPPYAHIGLIPPVTHAEHHNKVQRLLVAHRSAHRERRTSYCEIQAVPHPFLWNKREHVEYSEQLACVHNSRYKQYYHLR